MIGKLAAGDSGAIPAFAAHVGSFGEHRIEVLS
jgi:hypothetical protein